jgi:hypothetical protein
VPTVDREIVIIQRYDYTIVDLLGHCDQTSVREIHRLVRVFAHQPSDAFGIGLRLETDAQERSAKKFHYARRLFLKVCQPGAGLRQHRLAGVEPGKALKLYLSPSVMSVIRTQEGYQRPSVKQ